MKCEVCGQYCVGTPLPFCEECAAIGMGYEEIIAQLESLKDVMQLIKAFQGEFVLTKFAPIISILEAGLPGKCNVNLNLEEGDYGTSSELTLKINGSIYDSGPYGEFVFTWNTSSAHIVRIIGNINNHYGKGNFKVLIGTDFSSTFYELVKSLIY